MKEVEDTSYIETLKTIISKLEKEMSISFSKVGHCDLYMAYFKSAKFTEIFANEKSLFVGPEKICKKLFKDIVRKLEKSYYLTGDLKELVNINRA